MFLSLQRAAAADWSNHHLLPFVLIALGSSSISSSSSAGSRVTFAVAFAIAAARAAAEEEKKQKIEDKF